jgi:hypothetical protein
MKLQQQPGEAIESSMEAMQSGSAPIDKGREGQQLDHNKATKTAANDDQNVKESLANESI